MFTLLVVDDEEYALMGITKGIDWHGLGITRILEAQSAAEAEEILTQESVDVVISDIEMPGKTGLDLLKWMQECCSEVPVVFLTGHANFHYAQKALQYGCVEYLLKPVDYTQLVDVVRKVLKQQEMAKDQRRLVENYQEYQHLWESEHLSFASHLLRDIVEGRIPGDSRRTRDLLRAMDLPAEPESRLTLILIKVEQWMEEMDLRDKEVMRFAVRNVAGESLLKELDGLIFQLHDDSQFAVIYNRDALIPTEHLIHQAEQFIEACNLHLACHLSCYIAEPASLANLSDSCKELLRLEQENLTKPNSVLLYKDFVNLPSSPLKAPDLPEWTVLLEAGKLETLTIRIEEYLGRIHEGHASREMLESFCYGITSMAYSALHKSGMQVSEIIPNRERITEGAAIHSPQQALQWAMGLLKTVNDACTDTSRNESSMVREVKIFIENHILQEFSREDIANALHFNADYLSRVFKKETGTVLSDYIIFRRMTMARKLLEETNDRIADIANKLGYNHFSHFARQFRNIAGVTPQEYRMKYRRLQG